MWIPRRTRITARTVLRRERILPEDGDVLVHVGDFVQSTDAVARLTLPNVLGVVDVDRELRLRGQDVSAYLVKEIGEWVQAGEPLAVRRSALGLSYRSARSPVAGRVWRVAGNRVLLEGEGHVVEVLAYLRGRVTRTLGNRGVVVESTAAWIEGTWGEGGEGHGVLKVLTEPDEGLSANAVDISCHGSVVIAGLLQDEAALRALVQMQARGLIVGSMPASLVPAVREAGLAVVATEGLGGMPMSQAAYALLESHESEEVIFSGRCADLYARCRPEVVIPIAPAEEPGKELHAQLALGDRVRVLRGPQRGQMGKVVALPRHPQPAGVGNRLGARVQIDEGEELFVPWNNVELIG